MDANKYLALMMNLNPYSVIYPSWPVSVPIPVPQPISIPTPSPDSFQKKYNRTWRKQQIEQTYSLTCKYCEEKNTKIESLTLKDFQIIGIGFPQSPEQIMKKVNEVHQSGTLRPGIWNTQEDELLCSLINKGGEKWGQISAILNKEVHNNLKIRSGKQCKERWNNYLNPNVNRGNWGLAEEALILKYYRVHGKKWSTIAKLVRNRTESAVKNRIKSLLNKIKQNLATLDDLNEGIDEFVRKNERVEDEIREGVSSEGGDI